MQGVWPAFFGGFLGALIGLIAKYISFLWERNEKKNYSAIKIIVHLDMLSDMCAKAALDDGYKNYLFQAEPILISEEPEFSDFPDDIEWKLFDSGLVYRIFEIRRKLFEANQHIVNILNRPYFELNSNFCRHRMILYAEIGIYISNISNEVRSIVIMEHRNYEKQNLLDEMKKVVDCTERKN